MIDTQTFLTAAEIASTYRISRQTASRLMRRAVGRTEPSGRMLRCTHAEWERVWRAHLSGSDTGQAA